MCVCIIFSPSYSHWNSAASDGCSGPVTAVDSIEAIRFAHSEDWINVTEMLRLSKLPLLSSGSDLFIPNAESTINHVANTSDVSTDSFPTLDVDSRMIAAPHLRSYSASSILAGVVVFHLYISTSTVYVFC
jgi:hypothetical protein